VESRSKASAGSIVGGVVGALLAIAAILAVFFVRRNRRKKAGEGLKFYRSYFIKSAVKLDDEAVNEAVNASPSLSHHPAFMSERHADVVRYPSISRIDHGQAPYGMDSSDHPAVGVLGDQANPSYSCSPGEDAPWHRSDSPTLPGENPFTVPMEDPLAARV
jgi:hypothetical protein